MNRTGLFIATSAVVALSIAYVLILFDRRGEYFPAAHFDVVDYCEDSKPPKATVNDIETRWYSAQWRAAREPSLASRNLPSSERTYRFSFMPSRMANPIFVRIDIQESGSAKLTAKRMSGRGDHHPGRVAETLERTLTDAELKSVLTLIETSGALRQPAVQCDSGADGSRWILEASERDRYIYVNRWSPAAGPIRDVGVHFLSLADWKSDPPSAT